MKKRSLFALIMVFVLCLSMVMTGCQDDAKTENPDTETTAATEPKEVLTADLALANTANAISGTELSMGVLEDLNQKKTITVSMDQMFTNVLKMDLANTAFYDELSVSSEGDGISPDIKVNLYCDGTNIALVSPDLLGSEEAMGCTVESLVTSLMQAMMTGEGASAMGIIGQVANVYSEYLNDTTLREQNAQELAKALEGINATETEETVSVNGKDVKAVVFTYTMDKEAFLKVMDVMLKIFCDGAQKMTDALVESGMLTAEDAAEMPYNYEELKAELEAGVEGVTIDNTLKLSVNPDNRCVMRVDGIWNVVEEEEKIDMAMELVLGENPAESNQIALNLTANENSEAILALNTLLSHTTEGAVDTYSFNLDMDAEGETGNLNATYTYNNDTNAYKLTLAADDEQIVVSGTLESTADRFALTVDQVEAEGESLPLGLSLTVENTPDCEIPAVPEYTDISSMIDIGSLLGSSEYVEDEYYEDYEDYEDYENWEEDVDYIEEDAESAA